MAVEDELVTCTTCAGNGMVKGLRCPDCKGRGIVRVAVATIPLPDDEDEEAAELASDDGLESLPLVRLREAAQAAGLSTDGDRDELVARIRAGKDDAPRQAEPEGGDDLSKLNLAQLRERAVDLELDASGTKAILAERIRAKIAGQDTGPGAAEDAADAKAEADAEQVPA